MSSGGRTQIWFVAASPNMLQSNNTTDHRTYSQGEICLPNWALSLHYPPAVWVTVPDPRPADSALMRIFGAGSTFYLQLPTRADWGTRELVSVVRCRPDSVCVFVSVCSTRCSARMRSPCDGNERTDCCTRLVVLADWFDRSWQPKCFPCLLSCFVLHCPGKDTHTHAHTHTHTE